MRFDRNSEASPAFIGGTILATVVAAVVLVRLVGGAAPGDVRASIAGAQVDLAPFNAGHLCRATIAVLMGRDVGIIRVDGERAGIANVSYVRPDDGTLWGYRCKLEGNRIIWATIDGRWRDRSVHSWDELIAFGINAKARGFAISMIDQDGSQRTRTFRAEQF